MKNGHRWTMLTGSASGRIAILYLCKLDQMNDDSQLHVEEMKNNHVLGEYVGVDRSG